MVSGLVTSPFDHSRIWSGLASEMRIALKLLTSSMVLLRAAVWLGNAMRTVRERRRAGHCAAPRVSGRGRVQWLVYQSVLEPGEIDPAEVGQQVTGGIVLRQGDLLLVWIEDLGVEAEAPQFL